MEIFRGIEIAGRSLYVRKLNSLVIGDVHIGYEEELNKRGVLIPRHHFRDVVAGIEKVFRQFEAVSGSSKLENVIINGDLKHEFGTISDQEWREILRFIDLLSERCRKVVLIKGNHDIFLGPIARKRDIRVVESYSGGGIFICHGHRIPETEEYERSELVIIGNEHPAVSIKDGARTETFKCFLKGSFRGKNMIVMPSFNPITIGTDVLREKFISPFMKTDVSSFEVFVAEDRAYYFGKVKDLK